MIIFLLLLLLYLTKASFAMEKRVYSDILSKDASVKDFIEARDSEESITVRLPEEDELRCQLLISV